LKIELGQIFIV